LLNKADNRDSTSPARIVVPNTLSWLLPCSVAADTTGIVVKAKAFSCHHYMHIYLCQYIRSRKIFEKVISVTSNNGTAFVSNETELWKSRLLILILVYLLQSVNQWNEFVLLSQQNLYWNLQINISSYWDFVETLQKSI
jgi:hypothetical protein